MTLQRMFGQGKRLRYLCEDETRVGLKSETGRVITSRGVKPMAAVQWKRDNYWIYGVVEPLTGWHFTQEYQRLDSEQFQAFLDALSVQLGEDIALIQLDQASSPVRVVVALARELDSDIATCLQSTAQPH